MRMIADYYTEIQNTRPHLEFDPIDFSPSHFSFKTLLPFDLIKMPESFKGKQSQESTEYMKLVSAHLKS
jgi:hypothetical protein